jgi:hypothetical protein
MLTGNRFRTWTPQSSWAMALLLIPLFTQCGGQTELVSIEQSSGGTIASMGGTSTGGVSGRDSNGGSDARTTSGKLDGTVVLDECKVPPDPGACGDSIQRYYFDPTAYTCLPFTYSGCGGNGNNFLTVSQCRVYCTTHIVCSCPAGSSSCSTAYGCAGCPADSNYAGGTICSNPGLECNDGIPCSCGASDAGTWVWSCYPRL